MNIVELINYYMDVILVSTILIGAVLIALVYYLVMVKKVAATEEHIDYGSFNRESTMEYCKFDDIVADTDYMGGAGMIVINENTFVTGIDVVGYNYSQASAGEKQSTMISAVAFVNIIEQPVQMRQNVEAIDIGSNIEQFVQVREEAIKELTVLTDAYADLILQAESHKDDLDVLDAIADNLEQVSHRIFSTQWKIKEADNIVSYARLLQGHAVNTNRVNQILFSYTYNPNDFTEELSKEEKYFKAMESLKTKIGIYSASLSNCGCACKPLDADMIMSLIYRHNHPNSADVVNVPERVGIEMSTLYVTSQSLYDLEKERIGETAMLAAMENSVHDFDLQLQQAEYGRQVEFSALSNIVNEYGEQIRRKEGIGL